MGIFDYFSRAARDARSFDRLTGRKRIYTDHQAQKIIDLLDAEQSADKKLDMIKRVVASFDTIYDPVMMGIEEREPDALLRYLIKTIPDVVDYKSNEARTLFNKITNNVLFSDEELKEDFNDEAYELKDFFCENDPVQQRIFAEIFIGRILRAPYLLDIHVGKPHAYKDMAAQIDIFFAADAAKEAFVMAGIEKLAAPGVNETMLEAALSKMMEWSKTDDQRKGVILQAAESIRAVVSYGNQFNAVPVMARVAGMVRTCPQHADIMLRLATDLLNGKTVHIRHGYVQDIAINAMEYASLYSFANEKEAKPLITELFGVLNKSVDQLIKDAPVTAADLLLKIFSPDTWGHAKEIALTEENIRPLCQRAQKILPQLLESDPQKAYEIARESYWRLGVTLTKAKKPLAGDIDIQAIVQTVLDKMPAVLEKEWPVPSFNTRIDRATVMRDSRSFLAYLLGHTPISDIVFDASLSLLPTFMRKDSNAGMALASDLLKAAGESLTGDRVYKEMAVSPISLYATDAAAQKPTVVLKESDGVYLSDGTSAGSETEFFSWLSRRYKQDGFSNVKEIQHYSAIENALPAVTTLMEKAPSLRDIFNAHRLASSGNPPQAVPIIPAVKFPYAV